MMSEAPQGEGVFLGRGAGKAIAAAILCDVVIILQILTLNTSFDVTKLLFFINEQVRHDLSRKIDDFSYFGWPFFAIASMLFWIIGICLLSERRLTAVMLSGVVALAHIVPTAFFVMGMILANGMNPTP